MNANIDSLLPPEMALRAEKVGIAKARMPLSRLFALAVLAGAFIALGAVGSLIAGTGASDLPYGVARILVGTVFSLGLILVVVGGAELFTGNNLLVMAWAGGQIKTPEVLRNWGIVYLGNFVGAVGTAILVSSSGFCELADGAVGATARGVAESKLRLGFGEAVSRGVLCNALVCLAVWLSFSARSTVDRVLVVVPPIAVFVAAGFEHSVANMFFVPLVLWHVPEAATVSWAGFLLDNLLPVTIGNILGGGVLVGAVYWFVYLRRRSDEEGQTS